MIKIEDIPMFANINRDSQKELNDSIHIRRFAKKSIVFYEGDESDYLHILLEGEVRLYKTSPKDSIVQIHRLHAPATIGEYACMEHAPFPATCEFISERGGIVGLLHFSKVIKYLEDSTFALGMIKSLTNKVMLLSSLVHKETILSSEAKIADLLLHEIEVFNRIKNNEIASILNITPETLSRILSRFKQKKIITVKHQKVEILNLQALHTILEKNTIKACVDCFDKKKKKEVVKEVTV
jgi:CRP/FNR family transcriptional regulator